MRFTVSNLILDKYFPFKRCHCHFLDQCVDLSDSSAISSSFFFFTCWTLTFGGDGGVSWGREQDKRKREIYNSVGRANLEFLDIPRMSQFSCGDKWSLPSVEPGCSSLSVMLMQTGQTLKIVRCVWVCPMSKPDSPPGLYSPTPSLLEVLMTGCHCHSKGNIGNLQKGKLSPIPVAFFSICYLYFSSLWINAVLNNWIWTFMERATPAEQQLERSYIVESMRSLMSPGSWTCRSSPRYFTVPRL